MRWPKYAGDHERDERTPNRTINEGLYEVHEHREEKFGLPFLYFKLRAAMGGVVYNLSSRKATHTLDRLTMLGPVDVIRLISMRRNLKVWERLRSKAGEQTESLLIYRGMGQDGEVSGRTGCGCSSVFAIDVYDKAFSGAGYQDLDLVRRLEALVDHSIWEIVNNNCLVKTCVTSRADTSTCWSSRSGI